MFYDFLLSSVLLFTLFSSYANQLLPAYDVSALGYYSPKSIDGVDAEVSVLEVTWKINSNDNETSHFVIEYMLSSGEGNGTSSVSVMHSQGVLTYACELENITQGKCYDIAIRSYGINGNFVSSQPIQASTYKATPYEVMFEAFNDDTQALVTWKIPGLFTVSSYSLELISFIGTKSYTYDADSNSPKSYVVPLAKGDFYHNITITLSVTNFCNLSFGKSSNTLLNYAAAPLAPSKVELFPNWNNLKTSLTINFQLENVYDWYIIHRSFISDQQTFECDSFSRDYQNVTTPVNISTSWCNWLEPSTLYYATVQVENHGYKTSFGNISISSNYQATAPAAVIITEIEEVLDDDSHKTGKLRINWNKTEGGDEIDGFLVKCQSNSYEVEETVSYVPGQSHYEHITRKLFQGEVVNVTVSARNSAGNTSTEPQMFDIYPPVPSNVIIVKPLVGNFQTDFSVTWEMPELFAVTTYIVYLFQRRGPPIERPVYVSAPALNATAYTSCAGEIVAALLQTWHDNDASSNSLMSSWYQTDLPTPTNVSISRANATSLTVSWDSDACTADYRIKFYSSSGDVLEFEEYFPSISSPTTYSGFIPGQMYQATVQSFTDYGQGAPSLPSLPEQIEPHSVFNLSIKLDDTNPSKLVDLSWNTIGVGDNVTIFGRKNNHTDNFTTVINFSQNFATIQVEAGYNYSFSLFTSSYFLSSVHTTRRVTTKPEAPDFDITVTSMTSFRVDFVEVQGNFDFFVIESGDENKFPSVTVDDSVKSVSITNLVSYTYYNILMYSVVTNSNGNEERSLPSKERVYVFIQEFCEEEQLEHPGDKELVTFPRTQAGYSNTTVETCSNQNGVSYGTRFCTIDKKWNPALWISSCKTTLEDLAEVNITNNEEREEVASDLTVLTSNSSSLSSESIEQSASVLESIVDTEELEKNTTSLVIETVGNLLFAPGDELQDSGVQENLLMTLEEVTTKVHLDEGEEFQETTSTLAVAVVQTTNNKAFTSIGFKENINPSTDEIGFSEGQFQTFYSNSTADNSSSIFVPLSVVPSGPNGRVSFYAFSDNVFQVSNLQNGNRSNDVIDYDATVQSEVILSASIQGPAEDLTENITIVFNYTRASCPSGANPDDCGRYLCGFWDEKQSVWSQYGCTLNAITDQFIECKCNHLTNFATLFSYGKSDVILNNIVLDMLTYVCCGISLLGSILTITCLLIVWNLKTPVISNTTTFIMINLASALTLLNGFLLISNLNEVIENKDACTAIAVLLHFSLFATLLWTTVEAGYVCLGIVAPFYYRTRLPPKRLYVYSSLLGWLVPGTLAGLLAGINPSFYQTKESSKTCWVVPNKIVELVIIPASIILSINTVIYIVVIVTYLNRETIGETGKKKITSATGKSISFSFSLFVLFGITWIFGFFLFGSEIVNEIFAYIFTLTTALQGVFVFLLFVVRNKRIRQNVHSKLSSWQSDFSRSNLFTSSAA